MDKWNRPTPVCRRLSLAQAVRGKLIPTGLERVFGIKEAGMYFHNISCSIDKSSTEKRECQVQQDFARMAKTSV